MGINTTADNTATNNVAAIEISIVVMPHIISYVVPPLVSFSRFLPEHTLKGGKRGSLVSLTCMELFGFLTILKPVTMPKHRLMRIRFIDTPF
jgi:hypothetical protein